MRLWAWLVSSGVRKNFLQALILLVLAANVAVSPPFQQLLGRLKREDILQMSVHEEMGTSLQDNTPPKPKYKVCYNCSTSCQHFGLTDVYDLVPQEPAALPVFHEETEELKSLLEEPVINPFRLGFLHTPSHLCDNDDVDIILFVSTRPEDVYRRREIRRDKLGLFSSIQMFRSVEALFVMGLPSNEDNMAEITQTLIDREARKYRDIIQVNYTETRENSYLEAFSIFRWASSYCRSMRYVIHTNCDVILETKIIYSLRYIGKRNDNFVLGQIERRLPVSSYPATKESYTEERLPTFARKGLIGYPIYTVRLLYEAMLRVKPISLSDVYVTGLCALRIGAELIEDRRFRFDPVIDDGEPGGLI